MTTGTQNKEQILQAFEALVRAHKKAQSRISLGGEEAERIKDAEILEKASEYTVQSIVKGTADLQLGFASQVSKLADTLTNESAKVGEMKRAIEVEKRNHESLKNIKIVAQAALIRESEMSDKAEETATWRKEKLQSFEDDVTKQADAWATEQAEFEAALEEYAARMEKERTQDGEDHVYDHARQTKRDADAFKEKKRLLERTLAEKQAANEKNWAEREEVLTKNDEEHQANLAKIEAFPIELEEAVTKARKDALDKANKNAKVSAELMEKEVAASTQVFELKIESLEKNIAENVTQIEDLQKQLIVALDRSQNLAVKAIEKSTAETPSRKSAASADA